MILSCKCLNVSINLGKSKPKDVLLASLNLSRQERDHIFFSKGVAEVEEIPIVTKQIATLTISETIDDWTIESCLNCNQPFYAHHISKSMPFLISTNVINANEVELLKTSPNYSPTFRIIVNPSFESKATALGKKTVQTALTALQQLFAEAVRKEADKTDEIIRVFTDQQYEKLTQYQRRAQLDHEALVRLLHDAEVAEEAVEACQKSPKDFTSTPSGSFIENPKKSSSATAIRVSGRRSVRSNSMFSSSHAVATSIDVEGVFNLEGMDDSPFERVPSEADSESDHDDSGSHDEGIDIHRKKGNASNIARSLPVNVPVFPNRLQVEPIEIQPDQAEEGNLMDIAASIKALARSVHQDVFGELPRPRFSTQI